LICRGSKFHFFSLRLYHSFLSDERIFAFGCWISERKIGSERGAPRPTGKVRHNDFPVYYLYYDSTVDLLVKYFLPGFDNGITDGRVLAQTTLKTNILCPVITAVDNYIFNLLPIFHPAIIRYFVVQRSPGKASEAKEIRNGMNEKFGWPGGTQGST
jgi:hypothetical protein